jgi:hypothetical protein
MLTAKISCPHCRVLLQTTQAIAPGKTLKCGQCGKPFRVSAPNGPPPPSSPSNITPTPAANEDQIFSDIPVTPRRPRFQSGGKHRGLAVVGIVTVLLLAGGVGAVIYALSQKDATPHSQPKDDTEPVPPVVKRHPGGKDPGAGSAENSLTHLPPQEQKKVNQAIDQGVKYLIDTQEADGRWHAIADENSFNTSAFAHRVGYAALPGLTLLECNVPKEHAAVQKAAQFVRDHTADLRDTYDISLAILFLDRLGDPKDVPLIKELAVRLIAGQTMTGGWSYKCEVLTPQDQEQLSQFLGAKREPIDFRSYSRATLPAPSPPDKSELEIGSKPGDESVKPPEIAPGQEVNVKDPAAKKLPKKLWKLAVVQELPAPQQKMQGAESDNSNTQFAILALWAAKRHGVVVDKTMARVVARFRTSQTPRSGWGYRYENTDRPTATMTCAGLLGLAIGHGFAEEPAAKGAGKKGSEDPSIQIALRELGRVVGRPGDLKKHTVPLDAGVSTVGFLGTPLGQGPLQATTVLFIRQPKLVNLYFLWLVERVGVLYNLKTIGDKDWYAWGVETLLAHQKANGSWLCDNYAGSTSPVDTCLALLFLKRSNLIKDLSDKLERTLEVSDPGPRRLPGGNPNEPGKKK